jgi:hypothetical protein
MPWFQDVHTVGAIIAYAFYQAVESEGLTTSQAKMAFLGRWLERIRGRMLGTNLSLRDLLVDGVTALQKPRLTTGSCNVLNTTLPTERAAFTPFGC